MKWIIRLFLLVILIVPSLALAGDFAPLYKEAKVAARNQRYDEAERYFAAALKAKDATDKDKARAYFSLAKLYKAMSYTEKAIKFGKKASAVVGGNKKIDAFVAKLENNPTMTLEEAKQTFEDGLTNERFYKGTGLSLFDEAEPAIKRAMSDSSQAGWANYALGTIALVKKDNPNAEKYLKKSLDIDSRNADAQHRMGEYYLNTDEYDMGLQHLKLYKQYGGETAEGNAALVKAYGLTNTKVSATEIGSLVEPVASANIKMAAQLTSYFTDPEITRKIDSIADSARKKLASAGPPSTGGSSDYSSRDSGSSSSKSKEKAEQKKKEPEKTAQEKNYDKYNENRYREYLQHLNRLASGKPSSWSGAIPKKPEKEDKK